VREKQDEQPEPPKPVESPLSRRLEEIFGGDLGAEDGRHDAEASARDEWYRANRPPHHDR
jgi:hypothetical protein